jgi:hypothetical protein
MDLNLTVDPERLSQHFSGIVVRAHGPNGHPGTFDLTHLSRESLFAWLRSRGGKNLWAENTVAQLLGHEPEQEV